MMGDLQKLVDCDNSTQRKADLTQVACKLRKDEAFIALRL